MLVSLSSKLKGVYFFWHNGAIITLIKNRVIMRDPLRGSLENLLGFHFGCYIRSVCPLLPPPVLRQPCNYISMTTIQFFHLRF